MTLCFLPIKPAMAFALREGVDAYGNPAELAGPSTGENTPCRHCLRHVPLGQPFLIVAHRPFADLNPYTETGPIFLCMAHCQPGGPGFPAAMLTSPDYIVRGYSANDRIVYGSGAVTPTAQIEDRCRELFQRPEIAFIHIRSAGNNCFFCRVERAGAISPL